jgi:hypothetical protein
MIIAPLTGIALVVSVAANPVTESNNAPVQMSLQQKNAAIHSLAHSATECIVRAVTADPRFGKRATNVSFTDLIVESIPSCVRPLRAMIDTYDRYFGEGAGEAFFMGPYLEKLPVAVSNWGAKGTNEE